MPRSRFITFCFLLALLLPLNTNGQHYRPTERLRGANVDHLITEQDLRDLKAQGANLIRLVFAQNPFMALEPPYALRAEAFEDLERILDLSEKTGLKVIIDPHRYPGTEHPWTMLGTDPFWSDFKYHDMAIAIWQEIARRGRHRGAVIAGYDLLNEPQLSVGYARGTPEDLNLLYQKLTAAIREIDPHHTIILAAPRIQDGDQLLDYHYGAKYMELPEDDNLMVETHIYNPHAFSHQGVSEPTDHIIPYPSVIDGVYWNKDKLKETLQDLVQLQKQTGVPIFVGEFSVARWIGDDGNRYIRDILEICEENEWHWSYHAWREADIWNAERSNDQRADTTRHPSTPRLELLKQGFKGQLLKN